MNLQQRIEEAELTIKCFEFSLNLAGNATEKFKQYLQTGLEKEKAELQILRNMAQER